MIKLMELEWRKLKQKTVISEIIIYWGIIMFLQMFFIKIVNDGFLARVIPQSFNLFYET